MGTGGSDAEYAAVLINLEWICWKDWQHVCNFSGFCRHADPKLRLYQLVVWAGAHDSRLVCTDVSCDRPRIWAASPSADCIRHVSDQYPQRKPLSYPDLYQRNRAYRLVAARWDRRSARLSLSGRQAGHLPAADLPRRRLYDRLWSADCKPQELPDGCGGTARYLPRVLWRALHRVYTCGSRFDRYHRRCGRPDCDLHDNTACPASPWFDCGCSIFLYGACPDHPAADHEGADHQRRAYDQDGAAPSGFQDREADFPGPGYDGRFLPGSGYHPADRYAHAG